MASQSSADRARAAMFAVVASGGAAAAARGGDARGRVVLARGCDPRMAAHSQTMLPPLLSGATIIATTDDEAFFRELAAPRRLDAVLLAPGACRWSAARQPIPGGNARTAGWGVDEYTVAVGKVHPGVPVVATASEAEVVPLLRAALGLPA